MEIEHFDAEPRRLDGGAQHLLRAVVEFEIEENFGSCLDVQGSAAVAGSAIILVTCNGRPSQQWRVVDGQIIGIGDKCLDAENGAAADLTPLTLADCRGTPGQKWTIQ